MEVEFPAAVSGNMTAILKLFDPRHPPMFHVGQRGLLRPHGPHDQFAWEDFVRKDKLKPFLDEITAVENKACGPDGMSLATKNRNQTRHWVDTKQACIAQHWRSSKSETRAYGKLRDLQGK